jgi:hypothetical protein
VITRVGAAVPCFALGACTTQAGYHGMQSSQRQQCQKIDDRDERARCEKDAALPYDDYREQTAGQRKP